MSSTGVLVSRIRWANCEEYTTVRRESPQEECRTHCRSPAPEAVPAPYSGVKCAPLEGIHDQWQRHHKADNLRSYRRRKSRAAESASGGIDQLRGNTHEQQNTEQLRRAYLV